MEKINVDEILANLKIGADPEVFLFKRGAPVSAVGIVPGTKAEPFKVDKGAVQLDGMAAEFNIDPASTAEDFNNNIQTVLNSLKDIVGNHRLSATPVAHFGSELIQAQPESARELGCEPDYNAYTGQENPRPNGDLPFRTGAGHVHIGWTEGANPFSVSHFNDCRMLAIQLDAYLGLPSLIYDTDEQRRQMYGDFGAFRPKPYGMEYRVLSNSWLKDPQMIQWVFNQTKKAFGELFLKQSIGYSREQPHYQKENIERGYDSLHELNDWLCMSGVGVAPKINKGVKYVR